MKRSTRAVAALALTVACLGGCNRQQPKIEASTQETQPELKTLEDRYSYAYGTDLARTFKEEGVKVNVALLADAMQAVYDGRELKMPAGEIAATFEVFLEVHRRDKEAAQAVIGEKNKKEGEIFLRENAKKEGVVVTKSGLQYKIITKGRAGYKPTEEDQVKVHYRGKLLDGTEFENSYERGEPYSAAVLTFMQGWIEALQLMSEGSKWELYIPADLAYGEEGSPPKIGPHAVLLYEVELLEITKNK